MGRCTGRRRRGRRFEYEPDAELPKLHLTARAEGMLAADLTRVGNLARLSGAGDWIYGADSVIQPCLRSKAGPQKPVIRIVNLFYPGATEPDAYTAAQERIGAFTEHVGRLQPILPDDAAITPQPYRAIPAILNTVAQRP